MKGTYTFRGMVLPAHLKESLDKYIQEGRPLGHFLTACVDNDLAQAVGRADEENLKIIPAIVGYLYAEAPAACWGFRGCHKAWVHTHFEGKKLATEEN